MVFVKTLQTSTNKTKLYVTGMFEKIPQNGIVGIYSFDGFILVYINDIYNKI